MPYGPVMRLWLDGVRRTAAALVVAILVPWTTASAQGADAPAANTPLPGRIFLAVPRITDVQHGLLAVDPNDRTCVTLYEEADPMTRVAPGGQRVVFGRFDRPARKYSLLVFDLDREEPPTLLETLNNPAIPCWSGDGKQLLVCRDEAETDPVPGTSLINADGSGRQALAVPATEQVWDWSADRQWIITSSARKVDGPVPALPLSARPLYVMRVDGTEPRPIAPPGKPRGEDGYESNLASTFTPRFSPDGRRIALMRFTVREYRDGQPHDRHAKLWCMDRASQKRTLVFDGSEERGYPSSVVWSPDGLAIAIILATPLVQNEARGLDYRLVVLNLEGKTLRDIPLPHPSLVKVVDWR